MMDDHTENEELSTADLARAGEPPADKSPSSVEERIDDREVTRDTATRRPADVADDARTTPLLPPAMVSEFRAQWTEIQAGFVDEPRRAVERADGLVAEAIKHLAESFAKERSQLEGQWDRDGDVSTEDLRQALQRYRSFFTRLLSV